MCDAVHFNNFQIGIVVIEGVDFTLCLIDRKTHRALGSPLCSVVNGAVDSNNF